MIAALVAGAALVAAGVWQLPDSIRALDNQTASYAGQTALQRSLHAAYGEDIQPSILLEARRLMPAHATYAVATGPAVPGLGTNTLAAFAPFAGYWLLPRRQVQIGGTVRPDWVISYGGDLHHLGYRYRRVVRIGAGLDLAQVGP